MSPRDGTVHHGNRVFWIDEECYIIYLGSDGHGVRPFLRIGTSPALPNQIRRHIGSVVITDHLTGNPFDEDANLDPASPRTTRYVGGQELVDAVKRFVHREQIPSEALQPPEKGQPRVGGQVVYYEDGNARVFLDGHRLFDLIERERTDRHAVFRIQRVSEIISASPGAYRTRDLSGTGFVVASDGALLQFSDGNAFLADPHTERSIANWGWFGIDPALIVGIGTMTDPQRMSELYKYRLASGHAVAQSDGTAPDVPDRLRDAIDVFIAAGIGREPYTPPRIPAGAPAPAGDAKILILPEGGAWYGDVDPPLLPGTPYRYDDYPSELEFRHLLGAELRQEIDASATPYIALTAIAAREATRPIDRVLVALWIWNHLSDPGHPADSDLDGARTRLVDAFTKRDIPIVAIIRSGRRGWYVRFRPRDGLTPSAIADIDRARKKIAPLLNTGDRDTHFRAERNRLTAFLGELLAARRVAAAQTEVDSAPESRAPPPNGAPTEKPSPDGTPRSSNPATPRPGTSEGTETLRPSGSSTRERTGKRPVFGTLAAILLLLLFAAIAFWITTSSGMDEAVPATSNTGESPVGASANVAPDAAPAVAEAPSDSTTAPANATPPADTTPPAETTPSPDAPSSTDAVPPVGPTPPSGADEGPGYALPNNAGRTTNGEENAAREGDTTGSGDVAEEPAAPEIQQTTGAADTTNRDEQTIPGDAEQPSSQNRRATDTAPPSAVAVTDHRWTVLDVLRVTNWIATENGYRRVGVKEFTNRPDPDWIFPGNTFRLPDGKIHTVSSGETLWEISTRFLNRVFFASDMELARFRDLIDSEEYPVEELQN